MTVTTSRVSIMYFKLSSGENLSVFFFLFISMFNSQRLLKKVTLVLKELEASSPHGHQKAASNSRECLGLCSQSMRKENFSVCG